ncbi:MAG TPA: aminotransferase class I/II-fold pyridoxal phosphate-dependent enzyme [Bryobacteraceae bacterium]|jgi:cystathionine beta-lyase/cystathionine gamma-synthase|nr:aminotransferase class I/II-fold pyridoxal phosphate-dependent enzyme [Bryobacteraceae bacterium]
MKIESKLVHAGDRKKAGPFIPVTTPIYTAASYFYDSMAQLDRVMGREEEGPSYARYDNPTGSALEELVNTLENGGGAVACASGMSAVHLGLIAALLDRPKKVVAGNVLYGATVSTLMKIMEPFGVETTWVNICDLDAVERAIHEVKPGLVLMETVSNPLLRVGAMDKIAEMARKGGVPLMVDNTFATPLLVRPLELGASIVIHSATKYMAGHGDVLGGLIVADNEYCGTIRTLSRTVGPVMSPFEAYLTMRGIKTMGLRIERQCANACKIASWLASHPRIERVHFPGDPNHPDALTIARLFPKNLYGAMISIELKGGREEVFAFMEKLKMIVRATSLGDVHTMILYPAMASHRDLSPKHRARLGIGDGLVRISVGIEAPEDIIADLEQALKS